MYARNDLRSPLSPAWQENPHNYKSLSIHMLDNALHNQHPNFLDNQAGNLASTQADKITDSVIILFTRFPRAGETKTRLIPHLGANGAALLQRTMTEFTIKQAIATRVPLQMHFTGGTKEEMQDWFQEMFSQETPCQKNSSTHVEFIPQTSGDIGERMEHAFQHVYSHTLKNTQENTQNEDVKKVVLIGSDCPDNRTENILNAFDILDNNSCVIGPSIDGGYYLLGLKAHDSKDSQLLYSKLFHDIAWGTDTVFHDTKDRVKQCKLRYKLLPMLSDVDYPVDIPVKISVIIPTLNEEKNLHLCLKSLSQSFNIEIIVVDGGSSDHTCKVAQEHGAIICNIPREIACRALQMDKGVRLASGAIILFLHADSLLPHLWDKQIREIMQNTQNSLGYFRFAIQESFFGKNVIAGGTNLRSRFLRLPYGDQGLFVRKKDFESWEMKITPILEDVFLVKKARQYGKICCTHTKLYTSGRRWLRHGIIRTTCINQSVLFAARLGMDLHALRDAYQQGENPLFTSIKNLIQKGFGIWKK